MLWISDVALVEDAIRGPGHSFYAIGGPGDSSYALF